LQLLTFFFKFSRATDTPHLELQYFEGGFAGALQDLFKHFGLAFPDSEGESGSGESDFALFVDRPLGLLDRLLAVEDLFALDFAAFVDLDGTPEPSTKGC